MAKIINLCPNCGKPFDTDTIISKPFTREQVNLFRDWFDTVQDLNRDYLEYKDYELAEVLYEMLGMRVPNSIKENLPALDNESRL